MNWTVYWVLTGGGIVILYALLAVFSHLIRTAGDNERNNERRYRRFMRREHGCPRRSRTPEGRERHERREE
nr:MAG TPA: hypothetical protein [Caudoviricetes sp.]